MAATAAFSGLRPVAKAFGCGLSMRNTRGIGRLARAANSRMRPTYSGAVRSSTSCAPCMESTSLSEFQYEKTFMPAASTKAITMPVWPPIR